MKKIKVGLIIDEFFGGAGTAFGGYGYLAREYITKYIPNEDIEIDVLLGKAQKKLLGKYFSENFKIGDVNLYRLPRNKYFAKLWLMKKKYDIYLSIELTNDFVLNNEISNSKKLILWIQDPRPNYEWDEINTVKIFPEKNYYKQEIYDTVNSWYKSNRIIFISQGYSLNKKAIDLYNLDYNVDIKYFPNPMEVDNNFSLLQYNKKDIIIFLGRIESVKRGWLFCEIAKKMPQYQFYMIGQTFREKERNTEIIKSYENIKNLHFLGHLVGEDKIKYLKDAKILVNTSIHEAIPISFLEALSYGTLLVSNRNPDNLTQRFGVHVGDVLGDGFDKVDLFVNAIDELMKNDEKRSEIASKAIEYITLNHSVKDFIHNMREIIYKNASNK